MQSIGQDGVVHPTRRGGRSSIAVLPILDTRSYRDASEHERHKNGSGVKMDCDDCG